MLSPQRILDYVHYVLLENKSLFTGDLIFKLINLKYIKKNLNIISVTKCHVVNCVSLLIKKKNNLNVAFTEYL